MDQHHRYSLPQLVMPGGQTRTLWYLVDSDRDPALVRVSESANIDDLKEAIKTKLGLYSISTTDIVLWKLTDPEPIDETLQQRIKSYGDVGTFAEKLTPSTRVSTVFPQHLLEGHVHVLVKILPTISSSIIYTNYTAPRKNPLPSPASDNDHEPKRKRIDKAKAEVGHEANMKQDDTTYSIQVKGTTSQLVRNPGRKWIVNEEICANMNGCYYVDPGIQVESKHCLDEVLRRKSVLLVGARASGKTTRLFWLKGELEAKGHHVISVSFKHVNCHDVQAFWNTFGLAIHAAASTGPFAVSQNFTLLSSQQDFLSFFHASAWKREVVLIIDDFGDLYHASSGVRTECLGALREITNNSEPYAIRGFIAAGNCGISSFPSTLTASPFAIEIKNPYFSIDETRRLFLEFARDKLITIDDAVIQDIWVRSNGHPGMVCFCGRAISENLPYMLTFKFPMRVLSHKSWQIFSALHLNNRAYQYGMLRTIINIESLQKATPAVSFLQSHFVGSLDTVFLQGTHLKWQANFLVAEGVLLQSAPDRYQVASAFVDGLIRRYLIPKEFPNAPSTEYPMASDGQPHVLEVLTQSLKFFDKYSIRNVNLQSQKQSALYVCGRCPVSVPRESIYETEVMRILTNWLCNLDINCHWHLQDKTKYCNIVISKPATPTIIFQVVATGDASLIQEHIERISYYKDLINANEAWIVHFTCEDNYLDRPTWQSDEQLEREGINVVHFWHDKGFTKVSMSAQWKDVDGGVYKVNNQHVDF